jgi:hypothetical protein
MPISKVLLSGVFALALAGPGRAGDTQVVLSGGILINQGNTVDLTQKTSGGYTLEAGALFSPENFGPKIQVYLGYAHFPAVEGTVDRPTFVLNSPRFGADLVYQPWDSLPVTVKVGPSLHIWKADQKGGDPSLYPADQHLKLGWRAGLGYDFTKRWSASLYYTFTEWRSNPNLDLGPTNPSRPAYFSLMGSYRF